jgi:hypothetical protein
MNQTALLEIVDIERLKSQFDEIIGGIKSVDDAIKSVKPLSDIYKGSSGSAEARKAQDDLTAANQRLQKSQTDLSLSVQEYQRVQNQLAQMQAKMNAVQSEAGQQLAATREQQRQLNQEISKTAQANAAAEGSIKQLRAQLSLLTAEYDKMGAAQRNSASGNALKEQINGQVTALKQLEAETGRYQRNVGNYTGAIGILEKQLRQVKDAIDQNTKSGNQNSQATQKLQSEYSLLQEMLGQQERGFRSVTMEIRATERSLATMAEQGLQNTEAFKQLQMTVANAHRELTVFQQEQKLLSSQAPGLQAMMVAARGLGGIYATGAGAAALFADGNQKVEKELNKLVAIMTVLQGLEELHQLIEKKGVIIEIGHIAVQKLKNFVMTGSTKGIQENTIANLENAAAMEVSGAAATTASRAMVGLRVALLATGIGALLILLPAIATAMESMHEKSKKTKKGLEELAEQSELMNEALKNSEHAFVEAKKGLSDVTEALDLAKSGVISKKEAVDIYNESVGKTMGQVKSLDEVERKMSDKAAVKAYVDMMMYKAAANYALEQASKKAFEAEQQRLKPVTEFKRSWTDVLLSSPGMPTVGKANDARQKEIKDGMQRSKDETVKVLDDETNEMQEVAKNFQEKVSDIAKQFHFDPTGKGGDGKGDKKQFDPTAEMLKNEQELLKIKNESRKLDLADQQKYLEQIVADERNSYDLRISAMNINAGIQRELAKNQSKLEEAENDVKLNKIAEIEKKAASKRTDEEKKLLLDKQVLLKQKELAEQKYSSDVLAINLDLAAKLQKIQEDQKTKAFDNAIGDTKHFKSHEDTRIISDEASALEELNQKYEEGKISVEQYNKAKADIEKRAELDSIIAERKEVLQQIEVYKKFGKDVSDLELKAVQLHEKYEKAKTDATQKEADKRAKAEKEMQKKVADAAAEFGKELVDGMYVGQINKIQQQIDLNTKWKDAEVERINTSTLSEQDKAAKLAQIYAQAQAQQDKLDKQKRDAQMRQARFDRDMSLLKIAEQTAIAVVTDNSDPLTAWKVPYDIALGALQAAAILAKPIPAYEKGTRSSKGGFALTDEKGPELYIEPSGNMYLGNDHPTVRNLKAGTEVVRHEEVNQRLQTMIMKETVHRSQALQQDKTASEIRSLKEIVKWQTGRLEKALKNQKAPRVTINNQLGYELWKQKHI